MDRMEILEKLETKIKNQVGDRKVGHLDVTKNNGIKKLGITIQLCDDERISATHYVDEIIDNIISDEITLDDAVSCILKRDVEAQRIDFYRKLHDSLGNKDFFLSNVHRNLVNKETNLEYADQIPHKDFCDLWIIYRIDLSESMTVRVTNQLMENVDVSLDEVDEAARKNDHDKWYLESIGDMARRITGNDLGFDTAVDAMMAVISRTTNQYGAACITDESFMEVVSDRFNGDFYIIPSSVHECIAFSPLLMESVDMIKGMISNVNQTEVEPQDILSGSLYMYSKSDKKIKIA